MNYKETIFGLWLILLTPSVLAAQKVICVGDSSSGMDRDGKSVDPVTDYHYNTNESFVLENNGSDWKFKILNPLLPYSETCKIDNRGLQMFNMKDITCIGPFGEDIFRLSVRMTDNGMVDQRFTYIRLYGDSSDSNSNFAILVTYGHCVDLK